MDFKIDSLLYNLARSIEKFPFMKKITEITSTVNGSLMIYLIHSFLSHSNTVYIINSRLYQKYIVKHHGSTTKYIHRCLEMNSKFHL